MTRLLMNLVLLRNEYNIAIIPAITRSEYVAALEAGHKEPEVFESFIADRVIMTQLDILRLFQTTEPTPKAEDFGARLLETITANPGLNTPQLVARLGRSLRTTQRYLKQLSDAKRIVFKGVAKKGGYHPVDSSSLGSLRMFE